MKTFTSQIESLTQIRHSFCSRMLMLMIMTFALVFVIIGLAQAASAVGDCPRQAAVFPDARVTSITVCGFEEFERGRQYRLDRNLNCSATAIGINVSDVYLDLNGKTISGPGSDHPSGNPGIFVSGSNVHIVGGSDAGGNNGTVKGFGEGILVGPQTGGSSERNHFSGLTLTKNGTGLILSNSNANEVSCSEISFNDSEGVQVLANSNHNVIASNEINRNGANGILLNQANNNTIIHNKISRNRAFGVVVSTGDPGTVFNTIRDNTVNDNLQIGITVRDDNNTIAGNELSGSQTGIELKLTAQMNFVYGNTALGNSLVDLRDENENPDCDANIWTNNIFLTDNEGDGLGKGCIQ